jgi:hypothetical protein
MDEVVQAWYGLTDCTALDYSVRMNMRRKEDDEKEKRKEKGRDEKKGGKKR